MGEMRIDIDEPLLLLIEDRARRNERSLQDEIAQLLKEAVEVPRQETFYEAAVRITAMTPRDVQQTDSLDMLREDRAR